MKIIKIFPLPDLDVLFMGSFSSLIPALDVVLFGLKMVPVLTGKDLGKGKGSGHGKEALMVEITGG